MYSVTPQRWEGHSSTGHTRRSSSPHRCGKGGTALHQQQQGVHENQPTPNITNATKTRGAEEAHHNSEHLGNAFHIIFAAGILRPGSVDESHAAAILEHYQLQGIVTPAAILQSLEAYLKFLHSLFTIHHSRIEVPFSYRNPQGQRLTGYIDHLLETPDGSIIIDHKTSRADDDDARAEKALSYSGQLRAYRDALPPEQRDNLKTWIHFPLTGHLVEVRN